jgi:hypothetical protein
MLSRYRATVHIFSAFALGAVVLAATAHAQQGAVTLEEDRWYDRMAGVFAGRVQLEGGYTFLTDRSADTRITQHAVPDMLLRYGLTKRLELRLGWPGFVSTEYDGPLAPPSFNETLKPNVGFMWDALDQNGLFPQTALLAAVPITLEGNPFALNSLQPLSQVLYCWYVSDRMSFGGSTGLALFHEFGDHFVQLQQTASVDYLWSDCLSTFTQWEMLVDHGSANDGSQHLLSTGMSFLWTERLQTTWRIGVGLNERAPNFLTGIRFALRF